MFFLRGSDRDSAIINKNFVCLLVSRLRLVSRFLAASPAASRKDTVSFSFSFTVTSAFSSAHFPRPRVSRASSTHASASSSVTPARSIGG